MNAMKNRMSILIGMLMLGLALSVQAKVKPAAIFADNMVLQREQKALPIWGWATPNKQVKVTTSWDGKAYTAKADGSGRWKQTIATPVAGGPYTISFDDGEVTRLNNVLIGEVWLCSGQSNMEMPMKGFPHQPIHEGANMDVMQSSNPNIRLFIVERNSIVTPQEDVKGTWEVAAPASVYEFSAVGYYFGKMLHQALGVPVGLVGSYWGGSTIEAWMSREMLADFEGIKFPQKKEDIKPANQTPTTLYNGMLHPLAGMGMRGMIWYQGESNKDKPAEYNALFEKYITSLRKQWGIGDFPVYFCQIAPYFHYGNVNSAFLREAQLEVEKRVPNTGMAVLMDVGSRNTIHPMDKKTPGERLALQALVRAYGMGGTAAQSPVYKEMKVSNDTVEVSFDRAPMGLTSYYETLNGFTVAGEDKNFYPAKAWVKNGKVFVVSNKVAKPVAVRYAFENFPTANLYSVEGLPVSSFRTDKFESGLK